MSNQAEYEVIAVGVEGKYVVERTLNGEKHYLSMVYVSDKIGKYSYETARMTAYGLKCGILGDEQGSWLPWISDTLMHRPIPRFAQPSTAYAW